MPPLKWLLERRRTNRYRTDVMQALDPVDLAALASHFDKATGWLLVALGGFLLAVKETCAFTQRIWLTATIVVGLLALTALLVVTRQRRTKRVLRRVVNFFRARVDPRAGRSSPRCTPQPRRPRCVS